MTAATAYYPIGVIEKFERNLDLNEATGCLEWQGARLMQRGGYGIIKTGQVNGAGVQMRVHRLAWELAFGAIPDGLHVLHDCDNPPCCNPAHLFLGTIVDNNHDMAAKGRDKNGKKTHCPHGHLYDESNTINFVHKSGSRARRCRICTAARYARRRVRD